MDDLRVLGFHSTEPFEAMVDFCEVTVLKRRNALKKEKKSAKKAEGKPRGSSVRTASAAS